MISYRKDILGCIDNNNIELINIKTRIDRYKTVIVLLHLAKTKLKPCQYEFY
jgi:hypothetical protein